MNQVRRRRGRKVISILFVVLAIVLVYLHRPLDASLGSLDNADKYELFSLDPDRYDPAKASGRAEFHKHAVLGSTLVVNPQTQIELNSALKLGIHRATIIEMMCFDPRHGIRVTHGNVVTDFVICFECRQVEVWRNGARIAFMLTTASPQSVFDSALQTAHVPLAQKYE